MTEMLTCGSGLKVPVERNAIVRCRHGCNHAVARFSTSEGCVAFRDDVEQDLCVQHVMSWGFISGAEPLKVYIPEYFAMISKYF